MNRTILPPEPVPPTKPTPHTKRPHGPTLDERLDYAALQEWQSGKQQDPKQSRGSLENFHAIIDTLPKHEQNILLIAMQCDRKGATETEAAECAGMPRRTYGYRLQRALQHVEEAMMQLYSNGRKPPKDYREAVARAIDRWSEPTPEELRRVAVLKAWEEYGSERKAARSLNMPRTTFQRLLREARAA